MLNPLGTRSMARNHRALTRKRRDHAWCTSRLWGIFFKDKGGGLKIVFGFTRYEDTGGGTVFQIVLN